MINQSEVKEYLEQFARKIPNVVITQLSKGDRVKKNSLWNYEIDDPNIDRRLGEFSPGCLPYGPIHRKLKSSRGKILDLFGNSDTIPFSRVFEAGVGECLEKAILVQLATQREVNSFLISGLLEIEGEAGVDNHAYNVVFNCGKPYLVDAENPLAKDAFGNITHPYIAPIVGIENDTFVVKDGWKQCRGYALT